MVRLLVLLPSPPRLDAVQGGARATAQLLLQLAERHQLALVYLRGDGDKPVDPALERVCDRIEEVSRPIAKRTPVAHWRLRLRYIIGLAAGRPIWATNWNVPEYARRAVALARAWAPDVIQVEYHVMAQYLSYLDWCPAPRVLVEHEPGVSAFFESRRLPPIGAALIARLDERAWLRFERAQLDAVQAVVVFTDRDRDVLAGLGARTPLHTIALGTHLPDHPLDPVGTPPPTLLFVGSFVHPPNVDAAVRLAGTIFPGARAHHGSLRLEIVGESPPRELLQFSEPAISIEGRVPDVNPYLARAALVVAPLRHGGGMRVKVLEALAAGKALVASPLAIAGLDVVDGEHVAVAVTDEQFVEAICRLLDHPDLRTRLARQARAWATVNLPWTRSVAAYEALYAQLIRNARSI